MFKVGHAKTAVSVTQRYGAHTGLYTAMLWQVPDRQMQERLTHRRFADERVCNEFFDVCCMDACISFIKDKHGPEIKTLHGTDKRAKRALDPDAVSAGKTMHVEHDPDLCGSLAEVTTKEKKSSDDPRSATSTVFRFPTAPGDDRVVKTAENRFHEDEAHIKSVKVAPTCQQCKKRFSSLKSLKFHISRNRCKGVPPKTCPVCLKVFTTYQGLSQHVKKVKCEPVCSVSVDNQACTNTTNNTRAPCFLTTPDDERVVKTADNRFHEVHIKTVEVAPTCQQCKKPFSSLKSLKFHISRNRCKGVPPKTCPVCLKVFTSHSGLSQHVKKVKCKPACSGSVDNQAYTNNTRAPAEKK